MQWKTGPGYCLICGKHVQKRDSIQRCQQCASESGVQIRAPKYCEKCGKVTPHNGCMCLVCHPESESAKGSLPNFVVRDGVRYYKNQLLEPLCQKMLNGEVDLESYPGFDIRFGRVCYHNMNVLTDEKVLLNGLNFEERNGVRYVLDKSSNQYILWETVKEHERQRLELHVQGMEKGERMQALLDMGFEPVPVLHDENGLFSRARTDQYLRDMGITWFVYVKMFHAHPLIIGKNRDARLSFRRGAGEDFHGGLRPSRG